MTATTHTPARAPLATEVIVPEHLAAAFARLDRLTPEERQRVLRLATIASCTIDQACAAIEALRPAQQ